jgi:sugar lactone lactonase YvrE
VTTWIQVNGRGPHKRLVALIAISLLSPLSAGAAERRLPDITIDDTAVYPESMSAAPDGTVYIGSMKGIVFRARPGSSRAVAWIHPTATNGILSLLGVLADTRSSTLWLCSSPTPLRSPPVTGVASLMAFDLKSGERKANFPFPPPQSACNDITVAADGTVYATDTPNGRIFKLARGAEALDLLVEDPRLKGIDGIVMSEDGVMYVNIVTRGQLLRVDVKADGSVGGITDLELSQPVGGPDGFRLIARRRFLLAEGTAGRIDEVTIEGDRASIRTLKEGFTSTPGVTRVGRTAYLLEGKIGYLIDPRLKGQDPGVFKAYAVPID